EIACGEPRFAGDAFCGYVEAGADIQADFCLRARGDSMVGARIMDGDVVFVKEQPDVENGEIAAVILDDEATLKRINKNTPGFIFLMPENSQYKPIVINLDKLNESNPVRIIGKAVAFQSDVK
ncbi:MAG: S24 family peptidase, partial [Oscillospiraceae bacterium]|nr:S24 family peptidase [Oscillospiraceae bacterium]